MRRYNLQSRDTCFALRWKSIERRRKKKRPNCCHGYGATKKEKWTEPKGRKARKIARDYHLDGRARLFVTMLHWPVRHPIALIASSYWASFFFFLWIFFFSSSSPYSFKRKRGWSSSSSRLECCCLGRAPGVDVLHDNYTIVCVCVCTAAAAEGEKSGKETAKAKKANELWRRRPLLVLISIYPKGSKVQPSTKKLFFYVSLF